MSLITLAIVGKDNTPLYLRDFDAGIETTNGGDVLPSCPSTTTSTGSQQQQQDDPFGFFEIKSTTLNESCSLKHQFIMHSALDRCDELISTDYDSTNNNSIGGIIGGDSSGMSRSRGRGPNAMWIGSLGSINEMKVYGYMTNTKIKFLVSTEDVDDGNQQFAREAGLKVLFGSMHELYIEYTLNPFSQVRDKKKIASKRFDTGVAALVKTYNDTYSGLRQEI